MTTTDFIISMFLGLSSFVNIIVPLGGSSVVTPLLALLTDPHRAIGLASFFFLLSGIVRVVVFQKNIVWKEVRLFFIPSLVMSVIGAFFLLSLPDRLLLIVIFLFVLYFLLSRLGFAFRSVPKKNGSQIFGFISASLSGFLQGTGLAGSDIRNGYLYAQKLNLAQVHGTSALIGASNFFAATIVRLFTGQITLIDITPVMYTLPFLIAGTLLGRRVLYKLNQKTSDRIVVATLSLTLILLIRKIWIA